MVSCACIQLYHAHFSTPRGPAIVKKLKQALILLKIELNNVLTFCLELKLHIYVLKSHESRGTQKFGLLFNIRLQT